MWKLILENAWLQETDSEIEIVDSLKNLRTLHLNNNQIIEIQNLDCLVNLQYLELSYNQITEIQNLDCLVNLKHLYLNNNQITEIQCLETLTNLQTLYLNHNQITKIKNLDSLNLQELNLNGNQIIEIKNLDSLLNLQRLYLNNNQITEIQNLDCLVNLEVLFLENNNITKIKNLDSLVNLRTLCLDNNNISEIQNLDSLVNLRTLYLNNNQITEIKNLDSLVNLQELWLDNNLLTEIKNLDSLVNLQELNLYNNQISALPLSLLEIPFLYNFIYTDNPIEHIPLPVQRWLDRLNGRMTDNNLIYSDRQNVHSSSIQSSFRNSLSNIIKDTIMMDIDTVKDEIVNNTVLTENTKQELFSYMDDPTEHSTYLIKYSDLLLYVWQRIVKHESRDELLCILNLEIKDSECMCFTGRLTRLLNVLVGYYEDISIQISDSEQITNIIMVLKQKYEGEDLKREVAKELKSYGYNENIIKEWISYI